MATDKEFTDSKAGTDNSLGRLLSSYKHRHNTNNHFIIVLQALDCSLLEDCKRQSF